MGLRLRPLAAAFDPTGPTSRNRGREVIASKREGPGLEVGEGRFGGPERYLPLRERTGFGSWESVGGARVGKDVVQSEVGDPMEMPDVPGNELQVVVDGSGCDLQVGVG